MKKKWMSLLLCLLLCPLVALADEPVDVKLTTQDGVTTLTAALLVDGVRVGEVTSTRAVPQNGETPTIVCYDFAWDVGFELRYVSGTYGYSWDPKAGTFRLAWYNSPENHSSVALTCLENDQPLTYVLRQDDEDGFMMGDAKWNEGPIYLADVDVTALPRTIAEVQELVGLTADETRNWAAMVSMIGVWHELEPEFAQGRFYMYFDGTCRYIPDVGVDPVPGTWSVAPDATDALTIRLDDAKTCEALYDAKTCTLVVTINGAERVFHMHDRASYGNG